MDMTLLWIFRGFLWPFQLRVGLSGAVRSGYKESFTNSFMSLGVNILLIQQPGRLVADFLLNK